MSWLKLNKPSMKIFICGLQEIPKKPKLNQHLISCTLPTTPQKLVMFEVLCWLEKYVKLPALWLLTAEVQDYWSFFLFFTSILCPLLVFLVFINLLLLTFPAAVSTLLSISLFVNYSQALLIQMGESCFQEIQEESLDVGVVVCYRCGIPSQWYCDLPSFYQTEHVCQYGCLHR